MQSLTSKAMAVAVLVILGSCFVAPANAQEASDPFAWPRQLDADFGQIVIYQPQLESFANDVLEARAAVSVTLTGGTETIFGAMWFTARLATDYDERVALLVGLEVTAAKFPDRNEAEIESLAKFLETEVPQWDFELSLDHLLASMDGTEGYDDAINTTPPEIIFVTHPAVLVTIDGEPQMADLEGSGLEYVANTPFFIVRDPESKQYYLKGEAYWFAAGDLMGEWQMTDKLPQSVQDVSKQIDEEAKQQAAEAGEDAPVIDEALGDSPVPEIIVRAGPAEVVQTDDDPTFAPIAGTELLYMENTESDILMDISSQAYYVLLSGRWYTSKSMTSGEWAFVAHDALPAGFASIPADSDMGQVRVSVAGTQEAKESVLENQIPQTAEIDRKTATVTVAYDGDPKFEQCADDVAYALNTDKAVLLIDQRYWCCHEAVWFVSNAPTGPWQVATSVPKQVQDIPPDCPLYNVKYVYVYNSTPDVVYVAYTPAYTGSYVYGGCVVYGTGYWYQPWYHTYYYPRPGTWGFRAHWNPVTGWGLSFGVSYGWLHISVGRSYYGGWWGPGGYRHGYRHGYRRGYSHGYHHGARAGYRAGYRAGQRSAHRNMYNGKQGVRHTGVARTQPARGSTQARKKAQPSNKPNNVYADKNGNVTRNQNGQWQQKDKSGWSSSQGNSQVNKDQNSRQRGNARSQQNRSSRPRGGGGRRR